MSEQPGTGTAGRSRRLPTTTTNANTHSRTHAAQLGERRVPDGGRASHRGTDAVAPRASSSVCSLTPSGPNSDVGATSLATLVQMVAGGLGVSLLPKIAAEAGVTAGTDVTIRAFDKPVIGRRIGIAWRAGSPREDEARMIGESVRKTLAQRAA